MCVSPAPRWWHCTPGEQGGHGELGARSLFPTFSLTKASSPGTGEISLPAVEAVGFEPQGVTNEGKRSSLHLGDPGGGLCCG